MANQIEKDMESAFSNNVKSTTITSKHDLATTSEYNLQKIN